jgi:putative ABC transport system permease protein
MNNLYAEFTADTRYALRGFWRTRGLTAITVLTLALGLGATAAIFSVVNAVLLTPLPYANPERLVQIVENVPASEGFGGQAQRRSSMNVDEFDWWRQNSTTLSDVALLQREGRTLATDDGSVQLYGQRVSPALFAMRGVRPTLGRGLLPEDERPDWDTIVISESMWREYFRSDPNIVGRRIELDGRSLTVVGVMPPAFGATDAFWTPFVLGPPQPGRFMFVQAIARLREGVSLEAASVETNTLGLQLRNITPAAGAEPRFEIVRELDELTAAVAPALRVLVFAVAVVLAIVCTNVANLLLVRGTRRQQEIAIRRSLGATRGRIVRQVLTESLILALLGGVAAVAFAFGGVSLLKWLAAAQVPGRLGVAATILPRLDDIGIDPAVLAFVAGLSLVTGLVFGMLPALRLSRYGEHGHTSTTQLSSVARNSRLGHVLATVQFACAMALLIGAGLLLNSFLRLSGIDPGFDPRGALNFELVVPGDSTAERKLEAAETLVARLENHPSVTSAGFTNMAPLSPGFILFMGSFIPEGVSQAELQEEERTLTPAQRIQSRVVSPGYLQALGARLVEGSWTGEPGATYTVVVTRPYAQRFFPERSAIGATASDGFRVATIVGVVDDIHLGGLDTEPERAVFIDARQQLNLQRASPNRPMGPQADRGFLTLAGSSIAFAARTTGDPLAIVADLRAIVRDIDPRFAIDSVVPAQQVLSSMTARPRFYAVLMGLFGAIAGFIAVIGLYGVLAYVVSQRTKEIGVRMALGAQRASVLKLVVRQGAWIVAIGLVAGVAGAAAVTRFLEGMLYGLPALDVATFTVVAVAFAAVAMIAVYLPARRATAINPLVALRHD